MKANVTRSTARAGQPRLIIEATPEKIGIQFRCGKCQRLLPIDPDSEVSVCVCRNTVKTSVLLEMAVATYQELGGTICAVAGDDDYLDKPEAMVLTVADDLVVGSDVLEAEADGGQDES
jgi:hypothetical protein